MLCVVQYKNKTNKKAFLSNVFLFLPCNDRPDTRYETAAVSCCTNHASAVSTPLRWIFENALWKASHSCRITCERSESARERRTAVHKSSHHHHHHHQHHHHHLTVLVDWEQQTQVTYLLCQWKLRFVLINSVLLNLLCVWVMKTSVRSAQIIPFELPSAPRLFLLSYLLHLDYSLWVTFCT